MKKESLMGLLAQLNGFQEFASQVNIRQFSKTRKTRKSEDPLFYESRREVIITAEMVSVRPLPPEIESRLAILNDLFVKVDDPLLKRIYTLEYDILIEKNCGEADEEDRIIIHHLQDELLNAIHERGISVGEIESLCLSNH